jgi:hypothetical protein
VDTTKPVVDAEEEGLVAHGTPAAHERSVCYAPVVIQWSDPQRERVQAALDAHPAPSNRCAQAAQEVLPAARERDPDATATLVEPCDAIYVQAKGFSRWFHHVTVGVTQHYVDALTGADGHPEATYLETYFDFPGSHTMRPVEPDEWEVL